MKPGSLPSFTVLLGSGLVLALVVALPVTLALLPADMLQTGQGPGDLSAAALSSLDRDIQTQRVLPAESNRSGHAYLFLHVPTDGEPASAVQDSSAVQRATLPPTQGTCTPGATDARYLLLL